ncbi:hypothetical protein CBM2637_A140022 [Cupriavidus taiwanensis]|nr:hypothetical protein CBM2637_A140022 [Cupriavidus taiwanensis]
MGSSQRKPRSQDEVDCMMHSFSRYDGGGKR